MNERKKFGLNVVTWSVNNIYDAFEGLKKTKVNIKYRYRFIY